MALTDQQRKFYENSLAVTKQEIADLDRYFWDVWRRAEAGEIQVAQPHDDESDDEDESDAPTTIVPSEGLRRKRGAGDAGPEPPSEKSRANSTASCE